MRLFFLVLTALFAGGSLTTIQSDYLLKRIKVSHTQVKIEHSGADEASVCSALVEFTGDIRTEKFPCGNLTLGSLLPDSNYHIKLQNQMKEIFFSITLRTTTLDKQVIEFAMGDRVYVTDTVHSQRLECLLSWDDPGFLRFHEINSCLAGGTKCPLKCQNRTFPQSRKAIPQSSSDSSELNITSVTRCESATISIQSGSSLSSCESQVFDPSNNDITSNVCVAGSCNNCNGFDLTNLNANTVYRIVFNYTSGGAVIRSHQFAVSIKPKFSSRTLTSSGVTNTRAVISYSGFLPTAFDTCSYEVRRKIDGSEIVANCEYHSCNSCREEILTKLPQSTPLIVVMKSEKYCDNATVDITTYDTFSVGQLKIVAITETSLQVIYDGEKPSPSDTCIYIVHEYPIDEYITTKCADGDCNSCRNETLTNLNPNRFYYVSMLERTGKYIGRASGGRGTELSFDSSNLIAGIITDKSIQVIYDGTKPLSKNTCNYSVVKLADFTVVPAQCADGYCNSCRTETLTNLEANQTYTITMFDSFETFRGSASGNFTTES